MKTQNNVDGIIFSTDINFSYNVRNKCSECGIELNYCQSIKELVLYLFRNNGGLVFIDYNNCMDVNLLKEYIDGLFNKLDTFVFLSDDESIDVKLKGRYFISSLRNLDELIPKLKYIHKKDEDLLNISKGNLYKNIIEALDVYGISHKLIGYTYIKECIVLGVESRCSILNFSHQIYPLIACKYNTCTSNVDKNIRTAIRKAYANNPKLFENDELGRVALTNVGFLNYIIEKVKVKCME